MLYAPSRSGMCQSLRRALMAPKRFALAGVFGGPAATTDEEAAAAGAGVGLAGGGGARAAAGLGGGGGGEAAAGSSWGGAVAATLLELTAALLGAEEVVDELLGASPMARVALTAPMVLALMRREFIRTEPRRAGAPLAVGLMLRLLAKRSPSSPSPSVSSPAVSISAVAATS